MSEYRTVFRPEAQAELRKIPREMALRILAKLTEFETDPLGFNTTALVSQPERPPTASRRLPRRLHDRQRGTGGLGRSRGTQVHRLRPLIATDRTSEYPAPIQHSDDEGVGLCRVSWRSCASTRALACATLPTTATISS